MVEPEWFFSTLAQASATITGFILAFSAVIYQVERQFRERRTQRLREELIDFRSKYQGVVATMSGLFSGVADDTYRENISGMEFDKWLEALETDEDATRPRATIIWGHLHDITSHLTEIESSESPINHYLLAGQHFDNLSERINRLAAYFTWDGDFLYGLYTELAPSDVETVGVGDPHITEIFGLAELWEHSDRPRESLIMEEGLTNNIEDWIEEYVNPTADIEGRDLRSFSLVIERLQGDFQKLDAHRKNTIIDYSPSTITIFKTTAVLVLVGVLLPLLFLFSYPSSWFSLNEVHMLVIQFLLTVLTGSLTAYLIWLIFQYTKSIT